MGKGNVGALAQQHDGARRAFQLGGLGLVHLAELARLAHRSGHNGEGLARAALACPQASQRIGVLRVAHQVVAAQALHCHNAAFADYAHRCIDEPVGCFDVVRPLDAIDAGGAALSGARPPQMGAALEASIGLSMEAAVRRVVVFRLAFGAHREFGHGSGRAVVGQPAHDGEARAAVGAVDERVVVAPVLRVEQLFHAGIAGGQVGRNQSGIGFGAFFREADLERVEAFQGHFGDGDLLHLGSRGGMLGKIQHEAVQLGGLAFGVYFHAVHVVQHPPGDHVQFCLTIDKGAETHPLHYAGNLQFKRFTRHA